MKLQFYKNIDCVQINIKQGVREYFFPTNVDWADKKIDKMIISLSFIRKQNVNANVKQK